MRNYMYARNTDLPSQIAKTDAKGFRIFADNLEVIEVIEEPSMSVVTARMTPIDELPRNLCHSHADAVEKHEQPVDWTLEQSSQALYVITTEICGWKSRIEDWTAGVVADEGSSSAAPAQVPNATSPEPTSLGPCTFHVHTLRLTELEKRVIAELGVFRGVHAPEPWRQRLNVSAGGQGDEWERVRSEVLRAVRRKIKSTAFFTR
jgi:hypothetical protein